MKNPRRILVVTERFFPESFIVNELVESLVQRGLSVTVLTQEPSYPRGRVFKGYKNKLVSIDGWHGARVVRFKTIPGYRDSLVIKLFNYLWFALYGSIVAVLLPWRFDDVFIFQTGPLSMSVPAIAYAKLHHRPVRIWTQDVWPDSVYAYGFGQGPFLRIPLEAFVRWVYRAVEVVFMTCTEFSKSLVRFTSKPLVYAPSWPMVPYVSGNTRPANELPVFLFAGNTGKVQNLENLIKGFAIAWRRNPQIGILRIVGDGSAWKSLESLIKTEAVPVQLPGRKSTAEMQKEYEQADFLVLSLASNEIFRRTLPAKFSMYLSVGKPILCAASGVCANLVGEHALGFIADPDEIGSIAEAFALAGKCPPTEYAQFAANAKNLLEKEFDQEIIIKRLIETASSAVLREGMP